MFAVRQDERSHLSPREVGSVKFETEDQRRAVCENYQVLADYGIGLAPKDVMAMAENYYSHGYGMDTDLVTPLTTASITTPVQFLQAWLTGFTEVITAARRIDDLGGNHYTGKLGR